MANPGSVAPFDDSPFDYFTDNASLVNEQALNVPIGLNPNVATTTTGNGITLSDDPMFWNLFNGSFYGVSLEGDRVGPSNACNFQEQPSGGETSNGKGIGNVAHEFLANGGTPIPIWSLNFVTLGCTCCLVLREIIHVDDFHITKLEIHGRLGMICHAILEIWEHINFIPVDSGHYYMFDFCKKSTENVSQFLRQYCSDRKKAGFVMVQDPLSTFYQALCVGIDWSNNGDISESCPINSGEHPVGVMGEQPRMNQVAEMQVQQPMAGVVGMWGESQLNEAADMELQPIVRPFEMVEEPAIEARAMQLQCVEEEKNEGGGGTTKPGLSEQRDRSSKLTLEDLKPYFHLRIKDASKEMNLCETVLKNICRKYEIKYWPQRTIKSNKKKIEKCKAHLHSSTTAKQRAQIQAEIKSYEEIIARACGNY